MSCTDQIMRPRHPILSICHNTKCHSCHTVISHHMSRLAWFTGPSLGRCVNVCHMCGSIYVGNMRLILLMYGLHLWPFVTFTYSSTLPLYEIDTLSTLAFSCVSRAWTELFYKCYVSGLVWRRWMLDDRFVFQTSKIRTMPYRYYYCVNAMVTEVAVNAQGPYTPWGYGVHIMWTR